jgi:DeoR family glycerol-3-phosphate regulon repressor
VPKGASIYLDTGTTCAIVARFLRRHREHLKVFTNNLAAALALFGDETIEVVVPGGVLGRSSPDLTGDGALSRLRQWRFDLAIVGGDALDLSSGEFYSADLATAALSLAAQQRADRTFAAIDESKLDKRALCVAGQLADGVTLFTDADIPVGTRRRLTKLGVEIFNVGKHITRISQRKKQSCSPRPNLTGQT